nr:MAG TPA: hypothetical protein [Caudoviricetes sp.]
MIFSSMFNRGRYIPSKLNLVQYPKIKKGVILSF